MGRRSDIDWEAIEAEYRINAVSVRKVAEKYGIAPSAITRKAKKDGWARDLSKVVDVETKAGLIEHAKQQANKKATESAQESAQGVLSGVQAFVGLRVGALTKHQSAAADAVKESISMLMELRAVSESVGDIKEIAKAIQEAMPEDAKALRSLASLPIRATTLKTIIDALSKGIDKERQSLGISDDPEPAAVPLSQEQRQNRIKALLGKAARLTQEEPSSE